MNTDTNSILLKLIQISKDGADGFSNAAKNVNSESLKNFFLEKADGCNYAVNQLEAHITDLSDHNEQQGSIAAAFYRGYVNVKSILTQKDEYAILFECIRGEEVAKEAYEDALKYELPEEIHTLVQRQYEGVMENYNQITDLHNKYQVHQEQER